MSTRKNLKGQVFGMLTVIGDSQQREVINNGKRVLWECTCECGNKKLVSTLHLVSGHVKSCGCYKTKFSIDKFTKHGQAKKSNKTTEYYTWQNMKKRCYNPKDSHYKNYGARGIIVCDRWINSFKNFYNDMGYKPTKKHSIERIENNGNYEPTNCKWALPKEQYRNKSSNVYYDYNGERIIQSDLARILVCKPNQIIYFIKNGKSIDEIILHFKKINNEKKNCTGNII